MLTMDKEPQNLPPHLPNELLIHILTFIDDPHYLWTTCRRVSRGFKKWAEELYARNYLAKLRLELQIACGPEKERLRRDIAFSDRERLDFWFGYDSIDTEDASKIYLKQIGSSYLVRNLTNLSGGRAQQISPKTEIEALENLRARQVRCQITPEMDLGLRSSGQAHVCPCRSLKTNTMRGFCRRYIGAERFIEWDSERKVLAMEWVRLLNYVHAGTCSSP